MNSSELSESSPLELISQSGIKFASAEKQIEQIQIKYVSDSPTTSKFIDDLTESEKIDIQKFYTNSQQKIKKNLPELLKELD